MGELPLDRAFLAAILAGLVVLGEGCAPAARPPQSARAVIPPPPPAYDPELQAGTAAGERAAVEAPMAGWAMVGFLIGLALPVICAAAVAGAKGGGNCGGGDLGGWHAGGGEGGQPRPFLPTDAAVHTPAWLAGYDQGYRRLHDKRKEAAMNYGAVVGLGVVTVGLLFFFRATPEGQREWSASFAASAGPARQPAGAAVVRF